MREWLPLLDQTASIAPLPCEPEGHILCQHPAPSRRPSPGATATVTMPPPHEGSDWPIQARPSVHELKFDPGRLQLRTTAFTQISSQGKSFYSPGNLDETRSEHSPGASLCWGPWARLASSQRLLGCTGTSLNPSLAFRGLGTRLKANPYPEGGSSGPPDPCSLRSNLRGSWGGALGCSPCLRPPLPLTSLSPAPPHFTPGSGPTSSSSEQRYPLPPLKTHVGPGLGVGIRQPTAQTHKPIPPLLPRAHLRSARQPRQLG